MKVLPNRAPFFQNSWYIWFSFLVHTVDFWYVSLVRGLFRYARLVHIFVYWTKIGTCTRNDTCTRKMVSVPEKWAVYHIMYQYFQYSTKYVPEKSVRVPTDLSAYNSAYHHYQLVYRKEHEILVQNNCFLVHVPEILVHIGSCTNFKKGSSIWMLGSDWLTGGWGFSSRDELFGGVESL